MKYTLKHRHQVQLRDQNKRELYFLGCLLRSSVPLSLTVLIEFLTIMFAIKKSLILQVSILDFYGRIVHYNYHIYLNGKSVKMLHCRLLHAYILRCIQQ